MPKNFGKRKNNVAAKAIGNMGLCWDAKWFYYKEKQFDSQAIWQNGGWELMEKKADRTIITVVGKDTVGIIAGVCTYLADNGINVLDISQTIVQGFFNMMMIVDMKDAAKPFGQCAKELEEVGEKIGVAIKCQKEEIFNKMHRI